MARYPTPDREGHFWGKLVLADQPDGENLESVDWEVMQVFDNNGEGDEKYMVFVPGVERAQLIDAFIWGPEVHKPPELGQ